MCLSHVNLTTRKPRCRKETARVLQKFVDNIRCRPKVILLALPIKILKQKCVTVQSVLEKRKTTDCYRINEEIMLFSQ